MIELKEGAIFISDAHSNSKRKEFLYFLKKVEKGEIKTPQLILMGDMFDLLIGGITYLEKFYAKEIELLNILSKKIDILYFEGNHDFNLKKLFKNIRVFPLKSQPVLASYGKQKIYISHGDAFEKKSYKIYHTILRSTNTIYFLNLIDAILKNKLSKWYLKKSQNKKICKNIENFFQIIKQKISLYDIGVSEIDFVLEGHYHQGKSFEFDDKVYINFSAFACDERYFKLSGDKITFQ